MKRSPVPVKLPTDEAEVIAPVTILDAEGRVVRVVPAAEFHRPAPVPFRHWHERQRRLRRPGRGRRREDVSDTLE